MEVLVPFVIGAATTLVLGIALYFLLVRQQERQFKVLAQEIIQKNTDQYLAPFERRMDAVKSFVDDSRKLEIKERQSLKETIGHMMDSALRIEKETHQLSRALSSDIKFQGAWGEIVLERVLEAAGLEKGREYQVQNHLKKGEASFRPDVVINLPQETHFIIDSKVSLAAYFNYIDDSTEQALKELKNSLKKHIEGLSAKNYHLLEQVNVPEFVYLFIPVEGVYAVILKEFPEMVEEALRQNIVLVSPVNLLANLKTVSALWRIDKQSKSAVEIATKAGEMYDKFALLVDDMDKLRQQFKRVDQSFDEINRRLLTGRGNLVEKAQYLKDYGAKTSKHIKTIN